MKFLKVDTTKIDQLNIELRKQGKNIAYRQTLQGDFVVPASLISDETWNMAHEYLNYCEPIELTINDFPKDKMP